MNSTTFIKGLGLTMLGAALLAGCKGPEATQSATPAATTPATSASAGTSSFVPNAIAGISIQSLDDPSAIKNLTAAMEVQPRRDPFALTGPEKSFDLDQLAERLSAEGQTSTLMYEVPEEKDEETVLPYEQQPYRRLSGVLVGDSVLGILITPGQESGLILRPGQMVPGTDWRVVSIDEEKMTLRREGNHRPNEITVRLEQAPPGTLGSSGGGVTGGNGRAGVPPSGPGGGPSPNGPGGSD